MIPRIKEEVEVKLPVKKQKITVRFTKEQIVDALLDKYREEEIGPEKYNLPFLSSSKNVEISILSYLYDDFDGIEFVWYEDK
jgi:hypothetical protein